MANSELTLTTDDMFRRLAARGTVEVAAFHGDALVRWWPHGQKGNPLCGKTCRETTLTAALTVMLEATKPLRDMPLRWLVSDRLDQYWALFGVLTRKAA